MSERLRVVGSEESAGVDYKVGQVIMVRGEGGDIETDWTVKEKTEEGRVVVSKSGREDRVFSSQELLEVNNPISQEQYESESEAAVAMIASEFYKLNNTNLRLKGRTSDQVKIQELPKILAPIEKMIFEFNQKYGTSRSSDPGETSMMSRIRKISIDIEGVPSIEMELVNFSGKKIRGGGFEKYGKLVLM